MFINHCRIPTRWRVEETIEWIGEGNSGWSTLTSRGGLLWRREGNSAKVGAVEIEGQGSFSPDDLIQSQLFEGRCREIRGEGLGHVEESGGKSEQECIGVRSTVHWEGPECLDGDIVSTLFCPHCGFVHIVLEWFCPHCVSTLREQRLFGESFACHESETLVRGKAKMKSVSRRSRRRMQSIETECRCMCERGAVVAEKGSCSEIGCARSKESGVANRGTGKCGFFSG